jgi:hypothetical protein
MTSFTSDVRKELVVTMRYPEARNISPVLNIGICPPLRVHCEIVSEESGFDSVRKEFSIIFQGFSFPVSGDFPTLHPVHQLRVKRNLKNLHSIKAF